MVWKKKKQNKVSLIFLNEIVSEKFIFENCDLDYCACSIAMNFLTKNSLFYFRELNLR